jgi:hypothetical protein
MESTLTKAGELPPPRSLSWAVSRATELRREIDRIDVQLINPARASKLGAEYDRWRKRARDARWLFTKELRLLEDWITERAKLLDAIAVLGLVRDVFAALVKDNALEPGELEVARRVDQILGD